MAPCAAAPAVRACRGKSPEKVCRLSAGGILPESDFYTNEFFGRSSHTRNMSRAAPPRSANTKNITNIIGVRDWRQGKVKKNEASLVRCSSQNANSQIHQCLCDAQLILPFTPKLTGDQLLPKKIYNDELWNDIFERNFWSLYHWFPGRMKEGGEIFKEELFAPVNNL